MRRFFVLIVVLAASLAGGAVWWLNQSLVLRADAIDLEVEPGTSPRAVAQAAK